MMLPSPKIVVLDDNLEDTRAIVEGLSSLGTAAAGIRFTGDVLPRFPCLRVLFLDLHLMEGAASSQQQIKSTSGLLPELLSPDHGPYLIILWSAHPDECEAFREAVTRYLPANNIPVPLSIVPMAKADHIVTQGNGRQVSDPPKLREAILQHIEGNPQMAALLGWEEHVSRSSDDAIREIYRIAKAGGDDLSSAINRTLGELAVASAGLESARHDVFRATNEVLAQVAMDQLIHRSAAEKTREVWQSAVTDLQTTSSLEDIHSARLNSFLHVEAGASLASVAPWGRGCAIELSGLPSKEFSRIWKFSRRELLVNEFKLPESESVRWFMVQVQAPCDQAQQRSGLLPYVLGIRFSPSNNWHKKTQKKQHIWLSPKFVDTEKSWCFALHLRFVTGLFRDDVKGFDVGYRLREQLLAELTHELHSYGGRPGIVRFPR